MEYESAARTAERLKVNIRTVQLWAKNGKIPGAIKHGRDWLIPIGSEKENIAPNTPVMKNPMPIMNLAYTPGRMLDAIEAIEDEDERQVTMAEYTYLCGNSEKASEMMRPYFTHPDLSLKVSSGIIYTFANISMGKTHLAKIGMSWLEKTLEEIHNSVSTDRAKAEYLFVATIAALRLRFDLPDEDLKDYIKYLPKGIKLYSCYNMTRLAFVRGEYGKAIGISETGLVLAEDNYQVPRIYLHMAAAISNMAIRRVKEAKEHFMKAWELAYPDKLLQPFAVHHEKLHGLAESCLKKTFPKEYKEIINLADIYREANRRLHTKKQEFSEESLTSMEITIAMLAYWGWTNSEISEYLELSSHTVKHYISIIYQKIGISSRKELSKYLNI